MYKKVTFAITQITILIIAILAFAWIVGEIGVVSAADNQNPNVEDPTLLDEKTENSQNSKEAGSNTNSNENIGLKHIDYYTGRIFSNFAYQKFLQMYVKSPKVDAPKSSGNFLGITKIGSWSTSWASNLFHFVAAAAAAFVFVQINNILVNSLAKDKLSGDTKNVLKVSAAVGGAMVYLAYAGAFAAGGPIGWVIAAFLVIVALVTALLSKEVWEQGVVTYNCQLWQPPKGGADCEKCNDNGIVPCSEYQCKSLGQGCEFLPDEETGDTICFWKSRNDIEPPTIEADETALTPGYKYIPDTKFTGPDDRGVKIVPTSAEKCISPYEVLSFGVKSLNELATCKWDVIRKNTYEEMENYFSGSAFPKYQHKQSISIPTLVEGMQTDYAMYVRCEDNNGNYNKANLIFSFCIKEGLDTVPPMIIATEPRNEAPLPVGVSYLNTDVYTDKPATCKWSHNDKTYSQMEYNMSCTDDVTIKNVVPSYECIANLSGFNMEGENKFYFRCKNNPHLNETDRFVNTDSYIYILTETRPMTIKKAEPNNTIIKGPKGPFAVNITAETLGGEEDGYAICKYSFTDETNDYVFFDKTSSYEHSHTLWAQETGNYSIYIKCMDLANNVDKTLINFRVELDEDIPLIARVYKESGKMKIITNEKATCTYSTNDCSFPFEDGAAVNSDYSKLNHYFEWDPTTNFHVKCEDDFGNRPFNQKECSITIRASEN